VPPANQSVYGPETSFIGMIRTQTAIFSLFHLFRRTLRIPGATAQSDVDARDYFSLRLPRGQADHTLLCRSAASLYCTERPWNANSTYWSAS